MTQRFDTPPHTFDTPAPTPSVAVTKPQHTLYRRRWATAALLVAAGGILLLLQLNAWQGMSLQLLAWQRELHRSLTLAISGWSDAPSWSSGWWLMALSFGYGVFHAAGPGHGKAVLSTYLVSQGGGIKRALGLSFSAAMLQGLMAIALVLVLVKGLGWLTRQAMGSVAGLELASFLMVAMLGVWLCLRARRILRAGNRASDSRPHAHTHAPAALRLQAVPAGAAHDQAAEGQSNFQFHAHAAGSRQALLHTHSGHGCDCGARHHVAPEETGDWRTAIATVVAIGMRPCSGAVLLMGAASLLGHMALGAAAVMTMALGTALTVSALALLSVLARDWVTRLYLKYGLKHGSGRLAQMSRLGGWLALAGGVALVWLGLSLAWHAVTLPAAGPALFS
jgi:nickel/cobalt transporter (NicO) family protein